MVDVGARDGIDPRWELLGKNLKVLGFEPDSEECERLNKESRENHVYFPIALYNREGVVSIKILKNPSSSSIYSPNFSLMDRFEKSEDWEIIKSEEVPCNTLDNVLKLNNIQDVDFLKVDTQGSDLEVLKGGGGFKEFYIWR